MLVLTRKNGESILIGNDIELTVLEIKGDSVKIGIQAPKNVSVHRREVYDAIEEQNRLAAANQPKDILSLLKPHTEQRNT